MFDSSGLIFRDWNIFQDLYSNTKIKNIFFVEIGSYILTYIFPENGLYAFSGYGICIYIVIDFKNQCN